MDAECRAEIAPSALTDGSDPRLATSPAEAGLAPGSEIRAAGAEADGTFHHLHLPGRVLIQGAVEEDCTLRWVHGRIARVRLRSAVPTTDGVRAVLYLELIGRMEGTITWVAPTDMDVALAAPSAKWLRLEQQFSILAAMAPADRDNVRGFRRIALDTPEVSLSLTDGPTTTARVRDISRSGAAVRAAVLPEPGSIVTLGSTRGRVVRQFSDGFAVQFLRLLPLERFGPSYGL